MKLQIITNGTYEEEKALINSDNNTVLVKGDSYHDKIDKYISGFLNGLNFAKFTYTLKEDIVATPNMEIFNICNFYNGDDD